MSEPTITELNRLIYDLTVRAEQAERALAEKESEIEQLAEDYQSLGQERHEQMEALRATMSDTLDKLAESAQDIGQLRATLARVEDHNKWLQGCLDEACRVSRENSKRALDRTADRDELLELIRVHDANGCDGVRAERDGLREERDNYWNQLTEINHERDALRAEADGLRAERDRAQAEITIYDGECAHLNGMLILAESKESDQDAEISRLTAERDGLRARVEQMIVQSAGVSTAAMGWISDQAKEGDYGWSVPYQDVLILRQKHDGLRAALEWALGERDEFPPRQDGEGAFWWRKELRRRADLGL